MRLFTFLVALLLLVILSADAQAFGRRGKRNKGCASCQSSSSVQQFQFRSAGSQPCASCPQGVCVQGSCQNCPNGVCFPSGNGSFLIPAQMLPTGSCPSGKCLVPAQGR